MINKTNKVNTTIQKVLTCSSLLSLISSGSKPTGYFWVLIYVPIRTAPSLEIQSAPPGTIVCCEAPGEVQCQVHDKKSTVGSKTTSCQHILNWLHSGVKAHILHL